MKEQIIRTLIYLLLIVLCLGWIFPLISMAPAVVKDPEQFDTMFYWSLPRLGDMAANFFRNIGRAWSEAELGGNILNSLLYAVVAGVGSAFLASLGGFTLVHTGVKAPKSWFMGLFIGNVFPFQMFLIPLYIYLSTLGLYDTRLGLAVVYVGICVPFALFVYRNYSYTIPTEIFEAGKVDGMSNPGMFFRLFLPMSLPAFAVVFTFQFIWTWNDLLFGLVLSERYRPIMTALSKLQGARGAVPVPVLMAGTLAASIPTIVVMLSMQKYFIRGFTITAEK